MKTQFDALSPYIIQNIVLDNDGTLGVPVLLTSYTKTDKDKIAPVIEYIVGTQRERVGLEDDLSILTDLIEEYIVVVVDYQGAPEARGLALEASIQAVRRRIMNYSLTFEDRKVLREGDNWVLPAGCRLKRHIPYFDIREHAPLGTLDYIVKIWNEDFTEVRGNVPITFPDGTVKLVRDIHPTKVEECLRPNGEPIELKLHLDVIYPSKPKEGTRCPVIVEAVSRQSTTGNWIMPSSPGYITEFLYRGYAVMLFEHAYIPMARRDHYGYFPDGPSYKNESCDRHHGLGFQAGIRSSCAAVRLLRYLIRTDSDLQALDEGALGMICISKTGYNYALGITHPENLTEKRFLAPHHGECAEGVEQPYLTYPDGTPIPSNVQAMYSVSGSGSYFAREDMCPVLTTVGEEESALSFYRSLLENGMQYNTETLYYTIPGLGHSHALGYDPKYRLDMYGMVIDFMDTHLMRDHGECAYISPADNATIREDEPIVLHFTGKVEKSEVEKKVTIRDVYGKNIPFRDEVLYGGAVHKLIAHLPTAMAVFVCVPEGLTFANGVKTTRTKETCYQVSIETTRKYGTMQGKVIDEQNEVTLSFGTVLWRAKDAPLTLRFKTVGESAQLLGVYRNGERLGTVGVGPEGFYDFDLTGIDTASEPLTLTLRAEREIGVRDYLSVDFVKEGAPYVLTLNDGVEARRETVGTREVLCIDRDLYNYDKTAGYSLSIPLKESEWTSEDFGRKFLIHGEFMSPNAFAPHAVNFCVHYNRDPKSRYVDQFNASAHLVHTNECAGEWLGDTIEFSVSNPDFLLSDIDKRCVRIGHDLGVLYVGPVRVEEITTAVTIADGSDGDAPRLIQPGYKHG